jgi:Protein of unknown function DUF262
MSNTLEQEIVNARLEISADSISMSISELTSLFKEGILQIRPEFQRLFRWSVEQKSRLVESVLLGIPLPSLFVSQAESGTWELVDGLQRVSTLLELQGLLRGEDGRELVAFELTGTKYLPHLEGHTWTGAGDTAPLTDAQKLDIRLARLDIRVIKRSSDPKAKFDLFQRLNSYGSALTAQEVRSAMIAGTHSDALAWLTRLAKYESFQACVSLSDRLLEEQYDIELVLRFLMLHDMEIKGRRGLADFPTRLDDWSVELAGEFKQRHSPLEDRFKVTFDELASDGGEDIFRKWDVDKQQFRGAFLNTSFEVIALGLGYHVANRTRHRNDYRAITQSLWEGPVLANRFATGMATADRFVKTIPLGRKIMASPPEDIILEDLI